MPTRIMVVEDDDALRRSIALALNKFGFEVVQACDGAQALEIFGTTAVEAVVMDGKMPVMDGFETCGHLRAHPRGRNLPILLVTGMNEAQAIEQAYKAGATDFILKPIHLGVLSHRLKHLVDNARLQTALSSTRSTLHSFFSAMPSAVVFCNANWQLMDANPAAESLFGWPTEVMKGLPLGSLFADSKDGEATIEALQRGAIAQGREYKFSNASEKPFWGELVAAAVKSETEQQGYVLVISDITERRLAAQERERTAKLDLMGLLAGGIAHDFNNILTAVFSSVTLAQLEVDPTSKAAMYLGDAQPALEQAKRLSQQLLTFSKGGAPVRKLIDVSKLVRQTVEFSLRGSKVAPVYQIAEGCWPAEVDEGQIGQVISNLVVNADQAMPRGGRLWVSVGNEPLTTGNSAKLPARNYLKISVKDEGSGIPQSVIDKIYDPYFTTKPTGNGLGLATVLSIVKRHEGTIQVESVEGVGTTFHVWLPAQALRAKVLLSPSVAAAPATVTPSSLKVLLLEDQELIRTAVTKLLERCGCRVSAFDNGESTVQAYKNAPDRFDLVILDMTVPGGMSGLEAMKELQAIDPNVCAIVSTGYADDPVMAEPAKYGFRGILPKPYSFAALQQVLQEVVLRD